MHKNFYNRQDGIALIAAIGISLMLMLVAIAVAYRVGLFTKTTSVVQKKDQLTFVADNALENMRYYLWEQECVPPDWCGISGQSNYIDFIRFVNSDNDTSNDFTSIFQNQSITASDNTTQVATIKDNITTTEGAVTIQWSIAPKTTDNYRYSIYAKPGNTPDILYVFVSSKKVYQNEGQTQVLERASVESALFFSGGEEYKQEGQGKGRTGTAEVSLSGTNTFQL